MLMFLVMMGRSRLSGVVVLVVRRRIRGSGSVWWRRRRVAALVVRRERARVTARMRMGVVVDVVVG